MIAKKIAFSMVFGLKLPGFAISPDAIEYLDGGKPAGPSGPPQDAPAGGPGPEAGPGPGAAPGGEAGPGPGAAMPEQKFELTITETDGVLKGVLRSEHGCQKIDDIVESPFSLSFTAYSGSEGVEIFRYVIAFSDSTDQLVGYACGIKPFFRSFMPVKGTILEK